MSINEKFRGMEEGRRRERERISQLEGTLGGRAQGWRTTEHVVKNGGGLKQM